jgi:hypothetical protein
VTIQQVLQLPGAGAPAAEPVSAGSNGTRSYVISEADYYLIEHVLIRLAARDQHCQLARALRVVLRNARQLDPIAATSNPKGVEGAIG